MNCLQCRQWHPTPVLLPGKSHGWRSLVGCSPWGCWETDTTEWLHFDFSLSCIGEGNGNPLQCSCLENPRDGRAWWASVYGVAQSQTRLKWLSSSSSSLQCRWWGFPGSLPGLGRSPREGNGNPSSILAWEIPWTEESGSLQSMGSQELDMIWGLNHYQYHTIYLSNYPSNMQTCHIRGRPPLSCCFTFLACILIGESTVCHDHLK